MPHKTRLIGQGNLYIAIDNYTLATQARCNTRVYGPVYKIFFFIRDLLDVIHPFINIYVAGTATANATAIML